MTMPKSDNPVPAARHRRRPNAAVSSARETGPALEAMYQFLLWLILHLEKFPRSQKFLLGDRLQTQALSVLESLIAATYLGQERTRHLRSANLELEKVRFGIRLAKDLGHLDFARYEYAVRSLHEVGSLVGGWLKTHSHVQAMVPPAQSVPSEPTERGNHGAPALNKWPALPPCMLQPNVP